MPFIITPLVCLPKQVLRYHRRESGLEELGSNFRRKPSLDRLNLPQLGSFHPPPPEVLLKFYLYGPFKRRDLSRSAVPGSMLAKYLGTYLVRGVPRYLG